MTESNLSLETLKAENFSLQSELSAKNQRTLEKMFRYLRTFPLEETQIELLRKDLRKFCAMFRQFGKDSLLLATLAYNVGPYRLLGSKKIPKSTLVRKLEAGDRNIYKEYISFRCYKGKVVPSIERRRKVEYMLLFEE